MMLHPHSYTCSDTPFPSTTLCPSARVGAVAQVELRRREERLLARARVAVVHHASEVGTGVGLAQEPRRSAEPGEGRDSVVRMRGHLKRLAPRRASRSARRRRAEDVSSAKGWTAFKPWGTEGR